jgi:hypothetical protein
VAGTELQLRVLDDPLGLLHVIAFVAA